MDNGTDRTRSTAAIYRVVEAYKTTRDNLLSALDAAGCNVVLVCAAETGCGTSTVAANLSITTAQAGARVLLIDGDLRDPSLHRTFHVNNTSGLSSLLTGQAFDDCCCRQVANGVDLVPAGPALSVSLNTPAMTAFLAEMRETYDYVFVDLPSADNNTDAASVGDEGCGVLLVCRQNRTRYADLQRLTDRVRQTKRPLLGVILNGGGRSRD